MCYDVNTYHGLYLSSYTYTDCSIYGTMYILTQSRMVLEFYLEWHSFLNELKLPTYRVEDVNFIRMYLTFLVWEIATTDREKRRLEMAVYIIQFGIQYIVGLCRQH